MAAKRGFAAVAFELPAASMKEATTAYEAKELPQTAKANYFARHWRGDLSLGISYWLNGLLVYYATVAISEFVAATNQHTSLRVTAATGILLYCLILCTRIWQFVGVWRSASNHVHRGGKSVWAILAKFAVILGVLNLVRCMADTMVPQSLELANIIVVQLQKDPWSEKLSKWWKNGTDERGGPWSDRRGGVWWSC